MSGIIHKIVLLGREFTIQTELTPGSERMIRTLVYDGGRLVTSRQIALDQAADTAGLVEARVREQHNRIMDTLLRRTTELQAAKAGGATPLTPRPAPPAPPEPTAKRMPRPEVEPESPLEMAIAIRRIIGPFSQAFALPAPTTVSEYERTLEAVEAAIDAIMKTPEYEYIRLDEQLTFIALRGQLATWRLADRDLAVATEIWPSVERFAHHLQKINNRSDLVAFDHKLLTWAMSELGRGDVRDDLIDGLRGLAGRDAELDELLRDPRRATPHGLLEVLLGLLDQTLA